MKTILTIKQQSEFLSSNFSKTTLEHKWSCRGYGNSKIFDTNQNLVTKASGCGYDRFGTVIGQTMQILFSDELLKLAKRECKTGSITRKGAANFYGLFYNTKEKRAYVDGGCGIDSMKRILNKIGFELINTGSTGGKGVTGSEFYQLIAITKHARQYFN